MYEPYNMYAVLHTDNKTVVDVIPPDKTLEEIIKWANNRPLIKMTIKNSPASIGNIYKDGKFYSTKELING